MTDKREIEDFFRRWDAAHDNCTQCGAPRGAEPTSGCDGCAVRNPVDMSLSARRDRYRAADMALAENSTREMRAGIREETDEYLRLNSAVIDAEEACPWWARIMRKPWWDEYLGKL